MVRLEWNQDSSGRYISGVSHGVFYGEDGRATPWNGLISVTEKFQANEPTPVYNSLGHKYDLHGNKIEKQHALVCYTYPEAMDEYLGYEYLEEQGFWVDERPPRKFNMAYRSERDGYYELHVLLGQIATFGDIAHNTDSAAPGLSNITMNLQGVPHEVYGSSHLIFDSRNPITASAERILYGSLHTNADFNAFLEAEVEWVTSAYNYAPTIEPDYVNMVSVDSHTRPGIKNSSKWNLNNLIAYWDEAREQMALHTTVEDDSTESKLTIPLDVNPPLDLKTCLYINFGEVVSETLDRGMVSTQEPFRYSVKVPNDGQYHNVELRSTIASEPAIAIYHNGPPDSDDVYVDSIFVSFQNYVGEYFDGNSEPESRGERYRRVDSTAGYYTVYERLQFKSQDPVEIRSIGPDLYELTASETQLSYTEDDFTFTGPQATPIGEDIFQIDDDILGL